jgi:hypothetical protein
MVFIAGVGLLGAYGMGTLATRRNLAEASTCCAYPMTAPLYIYGSHAHVHSLRRFLPGGSEFAALVEAWSSEDVVWCLAARALEEAQGVAPPQIDAAELFGRGEVFRSAFPVSLN